MTTSFPETKEDFTAENGVTYTWDQNRWRTKAYKLDDSRLDDYLEKESANEVSSRFRVTGDGGTYISTAGDELGLYHLKTPTDGGHAANKSFVDSEIAKVIAQIPEQPDLSGYLSLSGGAMTGSMQSKLITCTRDSGYAFEVKPADESLAVIRTDGTAFFKRTKIQDEEGNAYVAVSKDDVTTKAFVDSQQRKQTWTFYNKGGSFTPTDKQACFSYKPEDDGEGYGRLAMACVPLDGPELSFGPSYIGFRPWVAQFSCVVETSPNVWEIILLGPTEALRYTGNQTANVFEVKFKESELIVKAPELGDRLRCMVNVDGLF